MVALIVQNVAFLGIAAFGLRRLGVSLFKELLVPPSARLVATGLGWGLALALSVYLVGAFEVWCLRAVLPAAWYQWLDYWTQRLGAEETFHKLPDRTVSLMFATIGSSLAPLGEECLFRGLVYHAIRWRAERVRPRVSEGVSQVGDGSDRADRSDRENVELRRRATRIAIVGSAGLFALLHLSPLSLLPLFGMGLAFGVAYSRTGSLWVPILMHGVNNGLMFVLLSFSAHSAHSF